MKIQIKSPLLGIDTLSSLPEIKEGFAIQLDNYFPTTSSCVLRKGWVATYQLTEDGSSTPLTDPVTAVFAIPEVGKILAVCGNRLYEATTDTLLSGALAYADVPIFQKFKNRVYIADGINPIVYYDISSGTLETPSLQDGAASDIYASVGMVNQQLVFIANNDLGFYVLPLGSVEGVLSYFDLSQVSRDGGNLLAAHSYGTPTDNGYKNYAAFITDLGEVIVYSSAWFSTAATTEIIGTFKTGKPLGRRCGVRWGADLIIICDSGINPISKIVSNGELIKQSELFSNYINGRLTQESDRYSNTSSAWTGEVSGKENFIMINTPGQNQLVMNIDTGAWCTFSGLKAYDISVGDQQLFIGTDGGIVGEYIGNSDNGEYIQGTMQLPYSKFGILDKKSLSLMRTRVKATIDPDITYFIGIDFAEQTSKYTNSNAPVSGTEWADASSPPEEGGFWDEAYWGDQGIEDFNRVYSIAGIGYDISIGLTTSTINTDIQLYDFIVDFEASEGAI